MIFLIDTPPSGFDSDPLIEVRYNYFLGKKWEECGVSKADGLLTALGFWSREEVEAFCSSTNVFEEFSTNDFICNYISFEDRQRLVEFNKASRKFNLAPSIFTLKPTTSIFEENFTPNYEDFFQFLFTWLTGGATNTKRSQFIAWWNNPLGDQNFVLRNRYAVKTDTTRIRKSFIDKVNSFLEQKRKPSQSESPSIGSKNPFVDAIHYVKTTLLDILLKPSDWEYVSGTDAKVDVQTPAKIVSVGAGGGTFDVYNKQDSKKVYPLKFALGGVGVGFGPSSPVNISISPSALPLAGKIYHGLGSSIFGDASFYGTFVTIGAGVADVFSQTSSIMFIAPNYVVQSMIYPGMDNERWAAILLSVIPASSAIIALDGNGVEASISVSAQFSCGFVSPNK